MEYLRRVQKLQPSLLLLFLHSATSWSRVGTHLGTVRKWLHVSESASPYVSFQYKHSVDVDFLKMFDVLLVIIIIIIITLVFII